MQQSIASNMPNLGSEQIVAGRYLHELIPPEAWSTFFSSIRTFLKYRNFDLIIINTETPILLKLCFLRLLFGWVTTVKIISVDVLLVRPNGLKQRLIAQIKRLLLSQVALFILYFKDTSGYAECFGIEPSRVAYVPFKVNGWDKLPPTESLKYDGDYVLCAGRTLRDHATFCSAMAKLSIPGILLVQANEVMRLHGSSAEKLPLPVHVKEHRHDGDPYSWMEFLRKARVVVIPLFKQVISSPGISTLYQAFGLKRCVIISESATTRGIIDNQAIVVPAEDPAALAAAIDKAWNDHDYRRGFADRGALLAQDLKDEVRLLKDIAAAALAIAGYGEGG